MIKYLEVVRICRKGDRDDGKFGLVTLRNQNAGIAVTIPIEFGTSTKIYQKEELIPCGTVFDYF